MRDFLTYAAEPVRHFATVVLHMKSCTQDICFGVPLFATIFFPPFCAYIKYKIVLYFIKLFYVIRYDVATLE